MAVYAVQLPPPRLPLGQEVSLVVLPPPLRGWLSPGSGGSGGDLGDSTRASGGTKKAMIRSTAGFSLSLGDGGPKPLKGLGSHPDLELLLRSGRPEEENNEEEDYFVAQGQQ